MYICVSPTAAPESPLWNTKSPTAGGSSQPFCVVGLPEGPWCSPLWPQAWGQQEKLSLAHMTQH